jgi:hypothetical protein
MSNLRTSDTAQHAIALLIPAFFRGSMETGGQNIRLHLIEEQCTEQRSSGCVRTASMTGETPWQLIDRLWSATAQQPRGCAS